MDQTTSYTSDELSIPRSNRGIRGRWVLLALAGLVGAIMLVGWLALRYTASVVEQQPPLSWQERASWPRRPVRETSLEASPISSFINGIEWRELTLTVPAGEEAVVRELAALARSDAFEADATRARLEEVRAERPGLFYASYLLATWHRMHGNGERAAALYEAAFKTAPRAIQQQYIDPRNHELPHLPVGRVEVICYRSDGQRMDDSLRLVYPALVTDERGFIQMPVYRTIYSINGRAEPTGYQVKYIDPPVFQFPGQVGTLDAAMVEQRPTETR